MAIATASLGSRPRVRTGPALRGARVPVVPLVLSAGLHAAAILAMIAAALVWRSAPPKAYVVNLVPATPAVGSPRAPERPAPPTPARVEEPKAPPAPRTPPPPKDLPPREEPVRAATTRELPQRPAEMPPRSAARPDPVLPERSLPRAPALRAGEKELPSVPAATLPRPTPAPAPPPAVARRELPAPAAPRRETPAPPLGRPSGSAQGSGVLSLTSTGDFPFTWYLQRVQAKITERWAPPPGSAEGQHVVIVFEIGRNGQASKAAVEKSSGNPAYDLAALRAVSEASPFPPLPDEFKESLLRVHLGFQYTERG